MKNPEKVVKIELNLTKVRLHVYGDEFNVSTKDLFILVGMLEKAKNHFSNMIKGDQK